MHVHPYEALAGTGGPPNLDATTDPHVEIYLDGSAEGSADVGVASWGFLIVANVPLHLGQTIEVTSSPRKALDSLGDSPVFRYL